MSGVIIKTGIYGILRMLMLIHENYLILGYIILIFSVITGIYGVMLAIVQHNLKKLLAYHSIENIGIIGIGIGIGALGTGLDYPLMAFAGYAGALMHTLNHSLFKSMLFYSAGNIYQSTHSVNIERMGGLIRKMPHTALMFLLASLAICGLPPFNGFISEFLIYSGLYGALGTSSNSTIIIILSVSGLALIGGLALFCFTKAFGIVFLGTPRHLHTHHIEEADPQALLPNYMIAILIIFIGVMPQLFIRVLQGPVQEFTGLSIPGKLRPFDGINAARQYFNMGTDPAGSGTVFYTKGSHCPKDHHERKHLGLRLYSGISFHAVYCQFFCPFLCQDHQTPCADKQKQGRDQGHHSIAHAG